jgi:hypothetical protein
MEIQLEFIAMEVFKSMGLDDKIEYILERVEEDKILVLDGAMTAPEASKLIEETMRKISEKFPGIEISTLHESSLDGWREKVIRVLGGSPGGLTVIGPSKLVKKVKQDPKRITLLAGEEKKKK